MPSAQCQVCGRKLEDSFWCHACREEVAEVLKDLALGCRLYIGEDKPTDKRGASYLRFLHDARLGYTRMGASERRSNEHSRPALARLTSNEKDSFAGSPLELSNDIHTGLLYWAQQASVTTETLAVPGEDEL